MRRARPLSSGLGNIIFNHYTGIMILGSLTYSNYDVQWCRWVSSSLTCATLSSGSDSKTKINGCTLIMSDNIYKPPAARHQGVGGGGGGGSGAGERETTTKAADKTKRDSGTNSSKPDKLAKKDSTKSSSNSKKESDKKDDGKKDSKDRSNKKETKPSKEKKEKKVKTAEEAAAEKMQRLVVRKLPARGFTLSDFEACIDVLCSVRASSATIAASSIGAANAPTPQPRSGSEPGTGTTVGDSDILFPRESLNVEHFVPGKVRYYHSPYA